MTVRSEICQGCCPNGGALFDAHWDDDGKPMKRCRNCGHLKAYRKPSAKHQAKLDRMEALIQTLASDQKAMQIIPTSAVTTIAMTTGNEKKFDRIVHFGRVKQWVGIGWIDEGAATMSDYRDLPLVSDEAE